MTKNIYKIKTEDKIKAEQLQNKTRQKTEGEKEDRLQKKL